MSWWKVSWREDLKEVESVVPDIWVSGNTLRWPRTGNVEKQLLARAPPTTKWDRFELISIRTKKGTFALTLR